MVLDYIDWLQLKMPNLIGLRAKTQNSESGKSPDKFYTVVYSRSGKSPDNISVIVLYLLIYCVEYSKSGKSPDNTTRVSALYLLIYCSFFGCFCICKQSGAKKKTSVSMLVSRRYVIDCAHLIKHVCGQCGNGRLKVQQVWKMNIHE